MATLTQRIKDQRIYAATCDKRVRDAEAALRIAMDARTAAISRLINLAAVFEDSKTKRRA